MRRCVKRNAVAPGAVTQRPGGHQHVADSRPTSTPPAGVRSSTEPRTEPRSPRPSLGDGRSDRGVQTTGRSGYPALPRRGGANGACQHGTAAREHGRRGCGVSASESSKKFTCADRPARAGRPRSRASLRWGCTRTTGTPARPANARGEAAGRPIPHRALSVQQTLARRPSPWGELPRSATDPR